MVHPDKCSHERAKEAFEVLNAANKDLLSEERRREVIHVLKMAKGEWHAPCTRGPVAQPASVLYLYRTGLSQLQCLIGPKASVAPLHLYGV